MFWLTNPVRNLACMEVDMRGTPAEDAAVRAFHRVGSEDALLEAPNVTTCGPVAIGQKVTIF